MHHSRRGRVRAPELTGRGAWIYTRHELSLVVLEGKVLLLNLWAFCCIDCLHILEKPRSFEERFDELVVVAGA